MSDLERLFNKGTSIAHCPLSNVYFSAKPFPLREALDQHVQVGLGTDVAGGYSLDIMNAMRQAVAVSRIREGERIMKAGSHIQAEAKNLSIDWKESLFLATRGGSVALGLEGMFKVGAPFDAQESKFFNKIIEVEAIADTFCVQFGFTILRQAPRSDRWSILTSKVVKMTMAWIHLPLRSLKNGGVSVTPEIGDVFGFKVVR
jgi:hypothetical protein